MLSWGPRAIKYYLAIVNLIFVITGIVLIAVGCAAKSSYLNYNKFVDSEYNTGSTFIIVLGAIIFFLSFLGCCGAIRENRCMLQAFSILLAIIFGLEICLVITAYALHSAASDIQPYFFNSTISSYYNNSVVKEEWDALQENLDCCGVYSPRDFADINATLPTSCCNSPPNEVCTIDNPTVHHVGCLNAVKEAIKAVYTKLISASAIIALIHLVSVVFAWRLSNAIRASSYESV